MNEVLKWLKETFHITDEESKSNNYAVFRWAALYGQIEVLKWLTDNFNIT
jgi:hypothetical protein